MRVHVCWVAIDRGVGFRVQGSRFRVVGGGGGGYLYKQYNPTTPRSLLCELRVLAA